jgi:hypothetical protein
MQFLKCAKNFEQYIWWYAREGEPRGSPYFRICASKIMLRRVSPLRATSDTTPARRRVKFGQNCQAAGSVVAANAAWIPDVCSVTSSDCWFPKKE